MSQAELATATDSLDYILLSIPEDLQTNVLIYGPGAPEAEEYKALLPNLVYIVAPAMAVVIALMGFFHGAPCIQRF